jgi:HNH endonuclease
VLLDPHGAVLTLGRAARLASPAQKRALLARDIGGVIPGCAVPGQHCDVHHPTAWADGGRTDITNLTLLCPRHHSEVHDRTSSWQIIMIHGVPWVRPPAWAHPHRPLLRNTTHRPCGRSGP